MTVSIFANFVSLFYLFLMMLCSGLSVFQFELILRICVHVNCFDVCHVDVTFISLLKSNI